MNLRKSILSLFAAVAIIAAGFGAVTAQSITDSQETRVTVNTNTDFDAYFCNSTTNFGSVNLRSNTLGDEDARTKTGTTTICYKDTTSNRQSFKTTIQAGSFSGSYGGSISNSQLSITHVENPQQGQWSSHESMCGPNNGTAPGLPGSNRPCIGDIAGRAGTSSSVPDGGEDWVGTATLNNQLQISYAYNGAGTAGTLYLSETDGIADSRLTNGSYHEVDLKLVVPQTTMAGTYTGQLNLYIYMNAAP